MGSPRLRVLIGHECSGAVRRAFRMRGHDAWSCDIKPAEDGDPHHFQEDVLGRLLDGWHLAIFFPDCTYLCNSGWHWVSRRPGRDAQAKAAVEHVKALMAAPIRRKAIENPPGHLSTAIRRPFQIIQPYQFGEDASKQTCLWLDGLMPLRETSYYPPRLVEWPKGSGKLVERWGNQTDSGQNKLPPSETRAAARARTYPGIADAFAEQWGGWVTC